MEVFGPTVQGEGVDQGVACHFVRFGGCDYACTWCDTPYAVLPKEVRQAEKLTDFEIVERLNVMPAAPWVILSGGNPALHDLSELVPLLHEGGYRVAVETQGSLWKPWMAWVDRLCVSFKPPSSLMGAKSTTESARRFASRVTDVLSDDDWFVKIVVFDETDFLWAEEVHRLVRQISEAQFILSAGNDAGRTVGQPDRADDRTNDQVRLGLLDSTRALTERFLQSDLRNDPLARVQAQQHVLLWGNAQGV